MIAEKGTEVLHVTNGDAAAEKIRKAGLAEHILPWRDLLSEGPVPARLSLVNLAHRRSQFIEAAGWASYREARSAMAERDSELLRFKDYAEVVFWFEHDLTDQLQMIQALERFAARGGEGTPLTLVTTDHYPGVEPFHGLAQLDASQLEDLYAHRRALTIDDFRFARRAWEAFRSPDPTAIEALLLDDTLRLPYLAAAMRRHLEQFPALENGLSRTERATLEVLAAGPRSFGDLFRATQDLEEAPFLSDKAYAVHVDRLSNADKPLVELIEADGGANNARVLKLTPRGQAALDGHVDWADQDYPGRWLGGVQLESGRVGCRWDRTAARLAISGDGAGEVGSLRSMRA
jgi:hypothetical protein